MYVLTNGKMQTFTHISWDVIDIVCTSSGCLEQYMIALSNLCIYVIRGAGRSPVRPDPRAARQHDVLVLAAVPDHGVTGEALGNSSSAALVMSFVSLAKDFVVYFAWLTTEPSGG